MVVVVKYRHRAIVLFPGGKDFGDVSRQNVIIIM